MTLHLCTHSWHEDLFLPLWLSYHVSAAPNASVHVLLTEAFPGELSQLQQRWPSVGFVPWEPPVRRDDNAIVEAVERLQRQLFSEGASAFVHLDADEFLLPTEGDLGSWLESFASDTSRQVTVPRGWNVVHQPDSEAVAFSTSSDALCDRSVGYPSLTYSKPCIVKSPSTWVRGFHRRCDPINRLKKLDDGPADPSIDLVHMAFFDLDQLVARHAWRAGEEMHQHGRHAQGMLREGWKRMLTAMRPAEDTPDFSRMRAAGPQPVKQSWRGKLLLPGWSGP